MRHEPEKTSSDAVPAQPIVAVTRRVPGAVEVPRADVRVLGDGPPERGALLEFVRGATVIVSMFSNRIDAEFLDAAGPSLRGICNFAVGTDNIDLERCAERGIKVCNTPDAVTEGTANMAWALTLAVARRVVEGDRFVRSGDWAAGGPLGMADFLGMDLTGRMLLVVGAGRIGLAVAHRARAHGMRTLYVARSRKWAFELAPVAGEWVSLEDGLRAADVVSVHTPLTDETHHLIGRHELAMLKPTAILVNTARGPVVDEVALTEALASGKLFGAGLDVLENEPRISPELAAIENVTLTPHIGSAERRFREAMTAMVSENAAAILDGRAPPNAVR